VTTALLALLAASFAADPLPDDKTPIDSLTYTFGGGVAGLGPTGSLSISKDGKVQYFYSSAPHTGSGGRVVQQKWELSKEERTTLFRKLVDDGLLETEEGKSFLESIRVTHGRWWRMLAPDKVPEKAMAHLRPLLAKADPELWSEKKPAPPKQPPSKPGTVTWLSYHLTTKKDGDRIALTFTRDGKAHYFRSSPDLAKPVEVAWSMPAKDAEALLDSLAADGLFELADGDGDKYPGHLIEAATGKWRIAIRPKEIPEKLLKPMLPLLKKADADFWK